MDIGLLSKMVGELIVAHDQVGLPGVGTFVAEMVPASFSDKGFTINPPYRRLSFYPSRLEDELLIDFYARSNRIDRETASAYLTQYLTELRAVLEQRKSITLPGLGRLRATRENHLFFVADEGLDIFPDGIGLRPVSLKSHVLEDDPVVIDIPLPPQPHAPEPEPEPAAEQAPAETSAEDSAAEIPVPEPPAAEEPAGEDAAGQTPETPEIPETSEPRDPAPADEPQRHRGVPDWAWTEPDPSGRKERRPRAFPLWPLILLALVVLFFGGFILLAHIAPDFIDSILYSPEELWILKY